ncbi:NACHT domain-containing protein, partial [Trinickia diaoshuihuensis]|uniref:NACHT domain-containing protein n=1 Tax=Trinickia diaoshuihuensis TaxID=2292265 RepID=UPI00196776D2
STIRFSAETSTAFNFPPQLPRTPHSTLALRSDDATPMAILGGYGKGKTSLALRLVSQQAERHRNDPTERIPILIRLGQVVHETQLEALFGKEFTARHPATDFRFQTLMHLNAEGRLLVILDGFDEMKHAMSLADFRATFKEFNRLLGPRAKVLLLGRPNALPTEARTHVLRGMRRVGSQMVNDPNFGTWREEEIAFFNEEEVESFLRAYLRHLLSARGIEAVSGLSADAFVDSRVREIVSKVSADLLSRPVQARIVADLAYNPSFMLDGFTKYTLYDTFIRAVIDRDMEEKRARAIIPFEPRFSFQQNLAWWSWTKSGEGQGYFNRDEIPPYLVERLPDGDAADTAAKLNEYIVSSLTEEKEAGVLYFAHRSFQEFLVADHLRTIQLTPDQHVTLSAALTPDIRGFLDEAPDQTHLAKWFETLTACSGPLSVEYLRYFQSDVALVKTIAAAAKSDACSPAHIAILGITHDGAADWPLSDVETIGILAHAIVSRDRETSSLAALCLLRMAHGGSRTATKAFVAALLLRVAQRVREPGDVDKSLTIASQKYGVLEEVLSSCMRKTRNVTDGIIVEIDIKTACQLLYDNVTSDYLTEADDPELKALVTPYAIIEPSGSEQKGPTKLALAATKAIEAVKGKETRETVEKIVRARGERFNVVKVDDRTRRMYSVRDDEPLDIADDADVSRITGPVA